MHHGQKLPQNPNHFVVFNVLLAIYVRTYICTYVPKCKYCPISHAHMSMSVCVCVRVHTLKVYSYVVYAVSKCTASQINSFRFSRKCKYCHISHARISMCVCVCMRACTHLDLVMSVIRIYSFKMHR